MRPPFPGVDPAIFPDDTGQTSGTDFESLLLQRKLHAGNPIVVIVYAFIKDGFDGRRNSLILTGLIKAFQESVISGF